jgi:hypothetical protein
MADVDDQENDLLNEKLDMMNPRRVQRDNFLNAISQIESSGGQNIDHPAVRSGIQAGQQAMGDYGLMPNTIQELNNRARLNNTLTPQMAAATRNPASVEDNPQLQQQYASQLADRVLSKYHDPRMAAYAWNQGHNLSPQEIQDRDYMNHPYVQKFSKIWKSLGNK